jgi:probable HAF family extracellular repeat protein
MRSSRVLAGACSLVVSAAVVLAGPSTALAAPTPTVLPLLSGKSAIAYAVNNAGVVAGSAELATGYWHAVVWVNGQIKDLGTLGGPNSQAEDVDDNGQVVGSAQAADGSNHAVVWIDGRIHDLGLRSDVQASALASSNGYIATTWYEFDNPWAGARASLVTGAPGGFTATQVDLPPGVWASAVNASGAVAGTYDLVDYQDPDFEAHQAYLWRNGTATKLGTLGGPGSVSNDLNDAGHVIGSSTTAAGAAKAFFWDGARMTALRSPADDTPTAQAINNRDVIVGTLGSSQQAVLWSGPTAAPRMLTSPTGSVGTSAVDINQRGVIVGSAYFVTPSWSTRPVVWR